jgi:hypothetical protein
MGIVLPCYVKKSTNKGHPRGTKGARCSAHACSREKVDLYVSY